jgi:uncharacterized membrane protein
MVVFVKSLHNGCDADPINRNVSQTRPAVNGACFTAKSPKSSKKEAMAAVVVESNDGTSAVSAVNTSERHDAGPGVSAMSRAAGVIGESSTSMRVLGQSEKAFGVNGKGLNDTSGIGGRPTAAMGLLEQPPRASLASSAVPRGSGNAARVDHQGAGIGFFGSTVRGIAAVFGQTSAANGAPDEDVNCVLLPRPR